MGLKVGNEFSVGNKNTLWALNFTFGISVSDDVNIVLELGNKTINVDMNTTWVKHDKKNGVFRYNLHQTGLDGIATKKKHITNFYMEFDGSVRRRRKSAPIRTRGKRLFHRRRSDPSTRRTRRRL